MSAHLAALLRVVVSDVYGMRLVDLHARTRPVIVLQYITQGTEATPMALRDRGGKPFRDKPPQKQNPYHTHADTCSQSFDSCEYNTSPTRQCRGTFATAGTPLRYNTEQLMLPKPVQSCFEMGGIDRDRLGENALFKPDVLQVLLEAILMIDRALRRALWSIGAVQGVQLLRLGVARLPAEVATSFYTV